MAQTRLASPSVVERGTTLQVFERTSLAGGQDGEILVEEEATLQYVLFQDMPAHAEVRLRRSIRLKAGATAHVVVASIGGSRAELDVQGVLEGAHATCNISVLAYAHGAERQTLTVRNVFGAANGGGEIVMRAVAEQNAHIRCDGMVDIGLQGGGTDTYLTQEVLMLDPTAKVDAIPGLEIKTNDVKASHSATVSRVTEEDLFYFASRGIPPREARRMFVEGFLGGMLKGIAQPDVRAQVTTAIAAKYGA